MVVMMVIIIVLISVVIMVTMMVFMIVVIMVLISDIIHELRPHHDSTAIGIKSISPNFSGKHLLYRIAVLVDIPYFSAICFNRELFRVAAFPTNFT